MSSNQAVCGPRLLNFRTSSNTDLHPSQIHRLPLPTRPLHPSRQPRLRLLIVEWPLRYHDQECESSAAQSEVEGAVDVLGDEAGEEGEDASESEKGGGEELGERLALEVLAFISVVCSKPILGW